MYNFYDTGIPNHPDYLALSDKRPSLMSRSDSSIGKYVLDDKPYSEALANLAETKLAIDAKGDITINGLYVCNDFEVGMSDTIGDFNVYWFGNTLMFYKGEKFVTLLNHLDSIKFLSYGSPKVSTYSLIMDRVNVKDHDEHVLVNGCVSLGYTGPWTPYWIYATAGYSAIIAQNRLITSQNGEVNYNERYNKE